MDFLWKYKFDKGRTPRAKGRSSLGKKKCVKRAFAVFQAQKQEAETSEDTMNGPVLIPVGREGAKQTL